MQMRQFIRENRSALDECIDRALGNDEAQGRNDEERELWVLNDESLYNWARAEGVRI